MAEKYCVGINFSKKITLKKIFNSKAEYDFKKYLSKSTVDCRVELKFLERYYIHENRE